MDWLNDHLKAFGEHGAGVFAAPTVLSRELQRQHNVKAIARVWCRLPPRGVRPVILLTLIGNHMIGTTGLHNLRVDCIVGIHPHEREESQYVFLDVELDSDFSQAAISDAIHDAIDYTAVATMVTTLLQERKFQLLEAMGEEVAAMLLAHDFRITAVRVEIRKPAAVPEAADSFVRVARSRS